MSGVSSVKVYAGLWVGLRFPWPFSLYAASQCFLCMVLSKTLLCYVLLVGVRMWAIVVFINRSRPINTPTADVCGFAVGRCAFPPVSATLGNCRLPHIHHARTLWTLPPNALLLTLRALPQEDHLCEPYHTQEGECMRDGLGKHLTGDRYAQMAG